MTLEERKRFDDMAEEDKTRYDLQMKPLAPVSNLCECSRDTD